MNNDHEEIVNINEKKNDEKDKNSSSEENSSENEDWEDLIIKIDKLEIKDENTKDKDTPKEDVVTNKPKEKIKIGRGFKEQSHSVLKNEPVNDMPKIKYKDEESKDNDKTKIESGKKANENERNKNIASPPKKRSFGRPGERNIAVASRMLRNALGIKSPLSEKEKQHEKRLQELREEKRRQSLNESSEPDGSTKKD